MLTIAPSSRQRPAFPGGFPSAGATHVARDETDLRRAVTAYRFWYPTVSMEGVFNGNREKGLRDNRIQTIPGRGWFSYFRTYGPQAPAFDGSWKPADFERLA